VKPPLSHLRTRLLVVALVVAVVGIYLGAPGYDDAFITYAYARSVATGLGLTWNGIPALGTTSPLLALLLAAAQVLVPLGIPVWGAILGWVSIGAMAAALLDLGEAEGWSGAGAVAAALLVAAPLLQDYVGGEFLPATAAVLVAASVWRRGLWLLAGVLLGLAAALRPEVGLAAPLLALAARSGSSPRHDLRATARVALAAALCWSAWLVSLRLLAGTVLPASLAAKRAQGDSLLALWPRGFRLVAELARGAPEDLIRGAGVAATILLLVAAAAGLVAWTRFGRRRPFATALLAWGPVHCLALAAVGVGAYAWYGTPLAVSFAVLVGWAWELPRGWPTTARRTFRTAMLVALATAHLVGPGPGLRLPRPRSDPKGDAYARVARFADSYPDGTRLAAYEVGYLGYDAHNPVVDLLGIVTPGVPLAAIRDGDLARVRDALAPDLLMLPLDGGSLVRSTVGAPLGFLSRYELDQLFLQGRPPIAVYRRFGLAGRGNVSRDLAREPAVRRAPGISIRYAERRNGSALAVGLRPGARFGFDLAPGRSVRFFAGISAPAGAVMALEALDGDRRRRVSAVTADGAPRWRVWSFDLGCSSTPCRFEVGCETRGPRGCLLAFPCLLRPSPADDAAGERRRTGG
jgi:hypothetical protein